MKFSLSFFILALTLTATAQVYTPPPKQPAPAPTGRDTVTRTQPQQTQQGGLFGNELRFYNPSNELISFNGQTWASSDNRLMEARFEKYLNEPEESHAAAVEYRKTIAEILHTISPYKKDKAQTKLYDAFHLLPRASSYPGDAKLCDSLANAIYTAMLAKRDVKGTRALISAMENEKKRLIKDNDWEARHDRKTEQGTTQSTGEGGNSNQATAQETPAPGYGIASQKYANNNRRILEIEGFKKGHQAKTEIKTELAKIQYQALMFQLFMQRRFQHVIMASRFYNLIWRDGDGKLYIDEKSEVHKLFTQNLGVSPTVSTLDSLANEAIRDIDKGVEAFKFLVAEEELESASKRLAESYIVGEFMPAIASLPRQKKRQVLKFVRGSNVLLNAIQAKDYAKAKEMVISLKSSAKDFDATKAEAAIAGFTRASNMSINAAKSFMIQGDHDKAAEEIRKATEAWPQNPKLAEFDELMKSGGTIAQARNDFDRLFSESNYREVVKRVYEFGPAVNDDTTRKAQLEQVVGNIRTIDTALVSAEKMDRLGQQYAAWEELTNVSERFPDDPVLNQRMREMAPRVAEFTQAIESAKEKESDGHLGSALSWFYQAKHLHPGSETAQEGIKRLAKAVLTK